MKTFQSISGSADSSTHLFMRKTEDDLDPHAMDEHDSFYHTTKSLLVLFQIMGIMPIMRSPKGERFSKDFIAELIEY